MAVSPRPRNAWLDKQDLDCSFFPSRRQGQGRADISRQRKISLQNDYAFCIISPIESSSVLPTQAQLQSIGTSSSTSTSTPISIPGVSLLPPSMESIEGSLGQSFGFRRWSICHYQQSTQPVYPSAVEISTNFVSDSEEDSFLSTELSRSSSTSSVNWLTDMLLNIPDRIRKVSREKNKFDVASQLMQDGEVRNQLRKMQVY